MLAAIAIANVALILLAFYVGFTPVGSSIITGVQGRYFLLAAGLTYLGAISLLPAWRDRSQVGVVLLVMCGLLTLRVSVAALGIYSANWH
ncbi:DUF2142 domain-containing protein [Neokomagataea tanensis]|uniref:DUF2142 domain-containing protein n=2 Tax=Neokomagataea TaxID=1223423 RepID=A0A4Y6V961_9PROT|nr:DUF2142 domain-containing protein [Neokomagataea tanensis]QDH25438.1 DUF2142 domain-containing protein [Neokomagataea tanensis]